MKYSINENRLNDVIINYISEMFPIKDINWTNPMEYEDFEEWEDENRIEFYLGDYGDGETIFRWYGCDFFDDPSNIPCPQINVEYQYENSLNAYFGDKWKGPFVEWFRSNFPDIKIVSVE